MRSFKYSFLRASQRVKDWLWNNRKALLPLTTAVAGLIWYVLDSGPEPLVVVVTSALTALMVWAEEKDRWYTVSQGSVFEVSWRDDMATESERRRCAHEFVGSLDFVYKFRCELAKGDSLNSVIIDTAGYSDQEFIEKAKSSFFVYYIYRNGEQIYVREW
ncbi:TPA: hypothetical protein I7114_21410 [Vibrio vulnificus]|nr:hypothetical protein [Vibrio vulnificus]HDY7924168.1 hypothetical protein [Vibrio vulnificus]